VRRTALIGAAWLACCSGQCPPRGRACATSPGGLATLTALAFWIAWAKCRGLGIKASFLILRPSSFWHFAWPHALHLPAFSCRPVLYLLFVGYLFCATQLIRANWKALVIFFASALLVTLPLLIFLLMHPGAETERAFQTEPIRALLGQFYAGP